MVVNKIIVLIDFTDCCKIALRQASVIAEKTGAKIWPTHIAHDEEAVSAAREKLLAFSIAEIGEDKIADCLLTAGDYMDETPNLVNLNEPDLVVVGTHGIRGVKQHLFGAYILKLVQSLHSPCIVVQENTVVKNTGFTKILFPIGPHPQYQVKILQTATIANAFDAEIVEYEISKMDLDITGQMQKNRKDAKEFFATHTIKHSRVVEQATVVSVGYSRQSIKYSEENGIDLISIMSLISPQDVFLDKADKENLLTNPAGIPVLCCNE